jgi:hypothetical protein
MGDPVSAAGCGRERERGRERSGDDRVPTGRPGQHSAGAAIQTVF